MEMQGNNLEKIQQLQVPKLEAAPKGSPNIGDSDVISRHATGTNQYLA